MTLFSNMQVLDKTFKPRETSGNLITDADDDNIYINIPSDFDTDTLV